MFHPRYDRGGRGRPTEGELVMRILMLVIAGSLAASCGNEEMEDASAAQSNVEQEIAARNDGEATGDSQPAADPEADPTRGRTVNQAAHPCMTQVSEQLRVQPIRALGTEPFWAAQVQGRCVTYRTPENQQGVRIWTRYSQAAGAGGEWVGQLDGQKFEMRVRPQAGCSDGMSDNVYPMAAELLVSGEKRHGCAAPL